MPKQISSIEQERSVQRARREYAPVRRIGQACTNCRRKKARCSGERPESSKCQSLLQHCVYSSSREPKLEDPNDTYISHRSFDELISKVGLLESQLLGVDRSLDRLLEAFGESSWPREPFPLMQADYEPQILGAADSNPSPRDYFWSLSPPQDSKSPIPALPSLEYQIALIDLYFSFCQNQPYSLFHEESFRHRFRVGVLPAPIILAVMANSSRFAEKSLLENKHLAANQFADLAWQSIKDNLFSGSDEGSTGVVQTLILLCIFDFTAGRTRHSSAWVKIGIAVRLAQDLRFVSDPTKDLEVYEREEQRRALWSLYILERLVSCGQCRPPALLNDTCLLQLLCGEKTWRSRINQHTLSINELDNTTTDKTVFISPFASVAVISNLLSECAHHMLHPRSLGLEDLPWYPGSKHATLVSKMLLMESKLDINKPFEDALKSDEMSRPALNALIFSRLCFNLCQLLLYHPFLLRENFLKSKNKPPPPRAFWNLAREMSQTASEEIIKLLSSAKPLGCSPISSFRGYCVTVCSTVQLLATSGPLDNPINNSNVEQFDICNDHLRWLAEYWNNAKTMILSLDELKENSNLFSLIWDAETFDHEMSSQERSIMWGLLDYNSISKNTPDASGLTL